VTARPSHLLAQTKAYLRPLDISLTYQHQQYRGKTVSRLERPLRCLTEVDRKTRLQLVRLPTIVFRPLRYLKPFLAYRWTRQAEADRPTGSARGSLTLVAVLDRLIGRSDRRIARRGDRYRGHAAPRRRGTSVVVMSSTGSRWQHHSVAPSQMTVVPSITKVTLLDIPRLDNEATALFNFSVFRLRLVVMRCQRENRR
jgi:hypothetical protein